MTCTQISSNFTASENVRIFRKEDRQDLPLRKTRRFSSNIIFNIQSSDRSMTTLTKPQDRQNLSNHVRKWLISIIPITFFSDLTISFLNSYVWKSNRGKDKKETETCDVSKMLPVPSIKMSWISHVNFAKLNTNHLVTCENTSRYRTLQERLSKERIKNKCEVISQGCVSRDEAGNLRLSQYFLFSPRSSGWITILLARKSWLRSKNFKERM